MLLTVSGAYTNITKIYKYPQELSLKTSPS